VKALLFLVVMLVGVWWWRSRQVPGDKKEPEATAAPPLDMVRCTQCGMHIPSAEAVQGKQGPYCSQEHLKQLEP
jgi:uncharacterized protein